MFGLILVILGILFLFEEMDIIQGDFWGYFWPIILICFGAVIGILVGSSFGRRFFVLLWYLLVLLLSIYAFEQNWVQRFKRRNWIK